MRRSERADQRLDWTTNEFVCQHCNHRESVKGVPYKELKLRLAVFRQEHKGCGGKDAD